MLKITLKSLIASIISLGLLASCSYIKKDSKCHHSNCAATKGNYKEENKLAPKDAKSESSESKADASKTGEKKSKKRSKKSKEIKADTNVSAEKSAKKAN